MNRSSDHYQNRIDNLRSKRLEAFIRNTTLGAIGMAAITTGITYFTDGDDYLVSAIRGAIIGGVAGYGITSINENRYLDILNKVKDRRDDLIVDENLREL